MKIEIITIGDEIMQGNRIDTNSSRISNILSEFGMDTVWKSSVGDDREKIADSIHLALFRSDVVITTGGLGPTRDDLTKDAVCDVFNKKLHLDKDLLKKVTEHFKKRKIKMPAMNRSQAMVPDHVKIIENETGTAPGLILKTYNGKYLFVLPGPSSQFLPMLENTIIPMLKKKFKVKANHLIKVIRTSGISESELATKLKKLPREHLKHVSFLPHLAGVDLKIALSARTQGSAEKKVKTIVNGISRIAGEDIYGFDKDTLESVIAKALILKGLTVSVAESCTGGMISNLLTDISGSSKYFLGACIAYSNSVKHEILKVSLDTLKKYGAVSRQVVSIMSATVRNIYNTDIGLSVSGIAGPTGGTDTKPVGLVYAGIDFRGKNHVKKFNFIGNRKEIKVQASYAVLNFLRMVLS